MAWDDGRFGRFVDATVRMARGELPGYGHPHVVFPYAPSEERACIHQLRALPGRLGTAGLDVHLIPVCRHVGLAVKRFASRPLETADDYERLQADLSDPRNGVAPRAAALCARAIGALGMRDGVVVLGRVGALYPFAHVSTFLEALHHEFQQLGIRATAAVAYPGSADGTRLRFLGLVDPTGGYRGHVVT